MENRGNEKDHLGTNGSNIGDTRNGYSVLAPKDRHTILLLSDDLRMFSGISTVSKEIILGTCHHFNWVQIAAGINHPESGKVLNMDKSIENETKVPGTKLTIYPSEGYGNVDMLRFIMKKEKPVAIIHFTDPRYWIWLYQCEREIRRQIPLIFYTIWDDLPYPLWNKPFYESCDSLLCISKQTKNIVEQVIGKSNLKDKIVKYVPHGVNSKWFKPIDSQDNNFIRFKNQLLKNKSYDFIALFNSRNIRRKMPSDLMIAFKQFVDELPEERRKKTALILKTAPVDNNGTNLLSVYEDLVPEVNIIILPEILNTENMNYLYNMADVTVAPSSAEGFGLSVAESVLSGTPIIASCIGGLQDQMRFVDDSGDCISIDVNHPTNSDKRYNIHGEWAFPLWPQLNLVGSPPTPYIYDSRVSVDGIAKALREVYDLDWVERKSRGLKGREWYLSEESQLSHEYMCKSMMTYIDQTVKTFKPRTKYDFKKVGKLEKLENKGVFNKLNNRWE